MSTLSLTFVTVPNLSNPVILISVPPGSFNPAAGMDEFMTNVDLRPVQNLFVTLDAKFSPNTNTITWSFNSIDPVTGLPPTDPSIGMLPPGQRPRFLLLRRRNTGFRPAPRYLTRLQLSSTRITR